MNYNYQILGTVITSMLDYDHLIVITKDPKVIDPEKSEWIPADGRSIEGSLLSKKTGMTVAPDLRGRFIRGLNIIYGTGQPPLDKDKADVNGENRKAGDYQGDEFRAHDHKATGKLGTNVTGTNKTLDVEEGDDKYNSDPNFAQKDVKIDVKNSGGDETRPKNIAVYFYIKIN